MVISAEEATARDRLLQFVQEKIEQKVIQNEYKATTDQLNAKDSIPFLNMSLDACALIRENGDYHYINPAFTNHLGYTLEDLSEKAFDALIHPDDRRQTYSKIQSLYHHDKSFNSKMVSFDARFIAKNGRNLWMHWQMKCQNGKIFAIGSNISALKNQQQELQQREK